MNLSSATHDRIKLTFPQDANIPILTCVIEAPKINDSPHFNSFYSDVAQKCADYCGIKLTAICAELYQEPRKTFSYKLSYKITQDNNAIQVQLNATLSDVLRRKLLKSHKETHLWEKGKLLRVVDEETKNH